MNIEICDLCGEYYGFLNLYNDCVFIEHTDTQLLCSKCRFNANVAGIRNGSDL